MAVSLPFCSTIAIASSINASAITSDNGNSIINTIIASTVAVAFIKAAIAFGILFGNEDKEGWMDFWDFAKSVHPSIDDTRVKIITDQAKGLTQLIAEVTFTLLFPQASEHSQICQGRHSEILLLVVM